MGIYLPNMEMPKSCAFCRFSGVYCYAKGDENAHSTLPCPLIPVPPHGRLIDERDAYDAIMEIVAEESGGYVDLDIVGRGLENAPTIIPESEDADPWGSFIEHFKD